MGDSRWLPVRECRLLDRDAAADAARLRLLVEWLETSLTESDPARLVEVLLPRLAAAVHADWVGLLRAEGTWHVAAQYRRPGTTPKPPTPPQALLGEVLDRSAALHQPRQGQRLPLLASPLDPKGECQEVLLALTESGDFEPDALETFVALAYYTGLALAESRSRRRSKLELQRAEALLRIARELNIARDMATLLKRIAEEAAELLDADRASIFIWDRANRQVVAKPALGLDAAELRLADDQGVVGQVIQTGRPALVKNAYENPHFNPAIDSGTGYHTQSLICVPLTDQDDRRVGAFEVLNKKSGEFTEDDLALLTTLAAQAAIALQNTREREELIRSQQQWTDLAAAGCQIIGDSPAVEALRSTVERVASTDLPVLVLGESGTGKEIVSRAIHYRSGRRNKPFIAVNCAALTETLLESELFGHERGAFTDARETRPGKFELASGGTLFLDEIGDMSLGGQAKLLRVLEEKTVYRVGGSQPIHTDTRVIASTNQKLAEAVKVKKFREDLFYRLTVVTLELPPLRDRPEDIQVLAEFFLEQFSRDARRKLLRLSAEARKLLQRHSWPGNVRELRNLMERVAYLCPNPRVEAEDLALVLTRPAEFGPMVSADATLAQASDEFQRNYIQKVTERCRGNLADVAKVLGMHRSNLYRKMRQLGVPERP